MTDQKSLRTRLKDGETVFGMFYKLNSPLVTEIMGWSGLDFIVVDCEHSAIGYESVEDIVRTGENVGLSTIIRVPSASEEHIFHALDCGASDFEADGDVFTIYTEPDDCGKVAAALEAKGYVFASAQVEMVPQNYVKLTDAGDIKNMEKLIDALEDNDDVQNVYHNWEQE